MYAKIILYILSYLTKKLLIILRINTLFRISEATITLSTMSQMELHLDENQKENCHHDHILFNLKRMEIFFSECVQIVFTIFRFIWNQIDVRSVPNQRVVYLGHT